VSVPIKCLTPRPSQVTPRRVNTAIEPRPNDSTGSSLASQWKWNGPTGSCVGTRDHLVAPRRRLRYGRELVITAISDWCPTGCLARARERGRHASVTTLSFGTSATYVHLSTHVDAVGVAWRPASTAVTPDISDSVSEVVVGKGIS
ncbi:hypothetical protein BaRGS_00024248, partial [Batillaria attramentaria]